MTEKNRNCLNNCKNKEKNGNCNTPGKDGFPLQCVGKWAENKYYYLLRLLKASGKARKMFSEQGNAIYIDLFSGSGNCFLRDSCKEIQNGGMRVIELEEAPFNRFYFYDKEISNIEAFKYRSNNNPKCFFKCGDSNFEVKELVEELSLKPYSYHFAFIDPFGPEALKFETIKELGSLKRMDMLIHFPIGSIKRNINNWITKKQNILNDFLGTESWQNNVKKNPDNVYGILIETFLDSIKAIGYTQDNARLLSTREKVQLMSSVAIKNTKNVKLYDLVFISKHPLGFKIWEDIIKIGPYGQKQLF